jgi:hypothetical protein
MVGNINPNLMPFFEALNPGFKIYIGDLLFFDYFKDAGGKINTVSKPVAQLYFVTKIVLTYYVKKMF